MSAMPIEWHEQCLANSIESHKRHVSALHQAMETERKSRENIARRLKQITRAKRLGKKSFDAERFGVE